ncbi:MAG: hypothetical protein IPP28_09015 [Xanthomonadales bacterium]|nr:hypothetical protein [Xanthomonadales bacterium]
MCRLFSTGTPVMKMRLSASEVGVLPALAKAVKPTSHNVSIVPCPYCGMNGGEVRRSRDGELECCCAECGAVPVDADDLAAFMLDDHWLHRKLRAALDVQSDGGSATLTTSAWLLGQAGNTPVVLTRDIRRLWREPGLLDRVRTDNGLVHVIAPAHQIAAGVPTDAGVEWLALEERFRLRGDAISFLGARGTATTARRRNDSAAPVHGPFSADFRLVYLDGEASPPIRCTKAQSEVFRALWEFAGQDRRAEDVMRRTGRSSPKPIDLFKSNKERLRAYKTLVVTNQKEGLYRMPCAAR